MRSITLGFMVYVLTGCGADTSAKSDVPASGDTPAATAVSPYSLVADSAAQLPACDAAHDHALAYTTLDKQFWACVDSAWTEVSIAGPQGAQGPAGAAGVVGTAAVPLVDYVVDANGVVVGKPQWIGAANDQLTVLLQGSGLQLYLNGLAVGAGAKTDAPNLQKYYATASSSCIAASPYVADHAKLYVSNLGSSISVSVADGESSQVAYTSSTNYPTTGCDSTPGTTLLYKTKEIRLALPLAIKPLPAQ